MEKMNVLAIGAHPDDIEFGCGGTLIKFAERGHQVFLMIMTQGEQGGAAAIRSREQLDSQQILGARGVFWGGYEDTLLMVNKEVISKIETVISQIKPDFIFCSYFEDTHQDHRHLADVTLSATRYIRNVLFYEGPTTQNFNPQVYVDITHTLDKKMESLRAHRSQITKTNIEDLTILELACSTATFRGIQGRVKYAEAFQAQRLFINILR